MKQIKVRLEFVKSTKGTHVYGDKSDNAPITSLYIQRSGVDGEPPKAIAVTVEAIQT